MIARNQAWNVRRLVSSVLRETAALDSVEHIFVDSASDDGTPELASSLDVRTIRISAGQHMSPAAGRYLGYSLTSGKLVLFLDGDSELMPSWLPIALDTLRHNENEACVTGKRVSLPIATDPGARPNPPAQTRACSTVRTCGGGAIYRRSALDRAGTFDPFLYSEEEPDLAIRLRHLGYSILRTEYPIIFDYTDPSDAISTVLARRRRRLYLGFGQVLRKHIGRPTFRTYVAERGFGVMPAGGLVSYGSLALLARRRAPYSNIVRAIGPLVFALIVMRKRSLYRAIHSLIVRLVILEGTVRGLLLPTPVKPYQPAYSELSPSGSAS